MKDFRYHRVMVIDDTHLDRFIIERLVQLNYFGKEVIQMESAMDALHYLQNTCADDRALPQIIFLDINMPVMNGFDFLEKYASLPDRVTQYCKVLMLSSSLYPDDYEKANSNPHVHRFLNKPLCIDVLNQEMDEGFAL